MGNEARIFVLKAGENQVGSRTEADVCLPETVVSRRHAVLQVTKRGVEVEDLDSTNGTFVNGVRITTSTIKEGDCLSFGSVPLTLAVVPADETRLAFRITPEPTVRGRDDSTELAQPTSGSHSLIHTAREVFGRLLGSAQPDIGGALSALADGIGAESAAYLRADKNGDATVLGLWGPAEHIADLSNGRVFQKLAGSTLSPITAASLDGGRSQVVAVRTGANRWCESVVATGARPDQRLESLLELVLLAMGSFAPENTACPPKPTRSVPELVLPDNHVEGHSLAAVQMYDELKRALTDSAPVLVTGETGAGKEHAVRILHESSGRADGPFEAVNCAAIPADLLEAELFGIEPGVATGVAGRKGKLALAHTGTIFFDEVGDMPPNLQAKLLRVIEQKEVHPVGARDPFPIDVRIVSSTNVDLDSRIRNGKFRADFFHRLAVHHVHVPPLRKRCEDIPELVRSIVARLTAEAGKNVCGLSVRALQILQTAPWPGNVRQLENELRRVVAVCPDGAAIESTMFSPEVLAAADEPPSPDPTGPEDLDLNRQVELLERRLLTRAITLTDGNLAAAARKLGITRNGLVMKMQRLGVGR